MPGRMAIRPAAKRSASVPVLRVVFWAFPGSSSWDDSVFGQLLRNCFQCVMQNVSDVADAQTRPGTDLPIRHPFIELEPHQFAAAIVQALDAQPHQTDPFEPD